jgi:hypothetical protein
MALSPSLHSVDLTFICPHCAHPLVKPGRWFKCAMGFKCESCKSDIRLTYSNKLALFDRYREPVQRAEIAPNGGNGRIGARPATQSTDLGVSKSQSSRSRPAAWCADARTAKNIPRIIFGDRRFQKGTV